jgi:hypothetical protein
MVLLDDLPQKLIDQLLCSDASEEGPSSAQRYEFQPAVPAEEAPQQGELGHNVAKSPGAGLFCSVIFRRSSLTSSSAPLLVNLGTMSQSHQEVLARQRVVGRPEKATIASTISVGRIMKVLMTMWLTFFLQ